MAASYGVEDVGKIISDMQDELQDFKMAIENMPGIGKGDMPPQLARLQNRIEQCQDKLRAKNDVVLNTVIKSGGATTQEIPDLRFPTITMRDKTQTKLSTGGAQMKPIKSTLKTMRTAQLMGDPLNSIGHQIVREKYSLPPPSQKKMRVTGKNDYMAKRVHGKITRPAKILSKKFRDDPFAEPPPITEDDISQGVMHLVNQGIIPRDVDLTPAFERGAPPFSFKPARIHDRAEMNRKYEIQTGDQFHASAAVKYDINKNQANSQQAVGGTSGYGMSSQALVPYQGSSGSRAGLAKQAFPISNVDLSDQFGLPAIAAGSSQKAVLPHQNLSSSQMRGSASGTVVPAQASIEEPKARSYEQLMDEYASHNIIIRKFKVVDTTPQFMSFKRTYISKWGSISLVLHQLEKMLCSYNVQFSYVDGKKVAELAEEEIKKPTKEKLFDCLLNQDQLQDQIRLPQRMFRGPKGMENAVIMIQKTWRMYREYHNYQQLKFLMANAALIQRQFRLYQFMRGTKAKIEEKNNEALYIWRQTQQEFKQKWGQIKKKRRVEIHINSLSVTEAKRMTMEKFLQRQNAEITRIFAMKDPNVDIIYVSPFQLTNDVIGYYMKIIEIGEIDNPTSRLNFIVPENYVKFPSHYSLAMCLMLSPKAIKRIKTLIKGKQAYIVPGAVSTEDIKCSIMLGVPILCGEPQKIQSMSTKSGAKRIFQQADVPTSLAAYDIYTEEEFYSSLARLIAGNPYVNQWIFKIDDEFNSRGHAWFNTQNVKLPSELRRKKGTAEAAKLERAATLKTGGDAIGASVSITQDVIEELQARLIREVPKYAKLSVPQLYDSDWKEFMRAFVGAGGVIEAAPNCGSGLVGSPSVAFIIEPDGEVDVIGSYDRFACKDMVNIGAYFPQTSLPMMNLMTISKSLGEVLYEKGIIGHVSVDLVSFPDPTDSEAHPLFWAVDLNLCMTEFAACQYFFNFMMGGKMDKVTGDYMVEVAQDQDEFQFNEMADQKEDADQALFEPRTFMFCKFLNHPQLSTIQYKMFFHLCRLDSISFDLEKRIGSTFVMPDCLQSGTIALLTIAEQRKVCTTFMNDALNFMQNMAGKVQKKNFTSGQARSDDTNINDIFSRIKLMQRQEERKAGRKQGEPREKYHDQMMRK